MYSVYCDSTLMHTDVGNNIQRKITDGNLSLEANTAGTLDLTIPFSNICYDRIQVMKSHISVFRDDVKIWGGRPVTESQDFDRNLKLTCEGEMSYLNDTYQYIHEYVNMTIPEFVSAILSVHNAKCDVGIELDDDDLFTSVPDEDVSSGTFDKTTYRAQNLANSNWRYLKIKKGARARPSSNTIISSNQYSYLATTTAKLAFRSNFYDEETLDCSPVRLMIEARPYFLVEQSDGSAAKRYIYEYRIDYGLSDNSFFKSTEFTSSDTFSKVFDDVKLTQTKINRGVYLVATIVIRRLDRKEITNSDITYLSTDEETGPGSVCNFQWKRDDVHKTGATTYSKTTRIFGSHRSKRIYPGIITMYDSSECEYRYTYYETTMQTLSKLVDNLGGVMRVRTGDDGKLYLDYLREYLNVNTQTIEFGKNLLSYTKSRNLSNLCTALLPLGAKKDTETQVGDEVDVTWEEGSIILSDGTIVYGYHFMATNMWQIEAKTTVYTYDSETATYATAEHDNRLYYIGEQINGYYMWMFYDRNKNPISGHKANSNTRSERFTQYGGDTVDWDGTSYISIPTGAKWVAFGFFSYATGFDTNGNELPSPELSNKRTYDILGRVKYETVDGVAWEWSMTGALAGNGKYWVGGYILLDQNKSVLEPYMHGVFVDSNQYAYDAPVNWNYVVSDPIRVKDNEVYYLTSRLNRGYAFYTIYREDGYPITTGSIKTAQSGEPYTDITKEKIEIPVNSMYMVIAGLTGAGIDIKLYDDVKKKSGYYETPNDYITIDSVNNGSLYIIDKDLQSVYGWIEKQVTFDGAENPEDLLDMAKKYMAVLNYDDVTLEVQAVDFNLVDPNVEAIDLLDLVYVRSPYHNLERYFPVTKLEIPILAPESQTITLGEEPKTLTISSSSASTDTDILSRLEAIPDPSSVIKTAVDNATNLINSQNNGFAHYNFNETLYSDVEEIERASKVLRINNFGIGFSSTGKNGPFFTAITMDGSIVADRITTGFMHADRIRGGTLTLGGYDNVNGEFYMLNAKGKRFVAMTKDGAEMIVKISQPYGFTNRFSNGSLDFGILNIENGRIYGSSANLNIRDTNTLQGTNWFDNYVFSFDDVKSQTNLTRLDMYSGGTNDKGIEILANKSFAMLLNTPSDLPVYSGVGSTYRGIFMNDGGFLLKLQTGNNGSSIKWTPGSSNQLGLNGLVMDIQDFNVLIGNTSLNSLNGTYSFGTNGSITINHGFVTNCVSGSGGGSGNDPDFTSVGDSLYSFYNSLDDGTYATKYSVGDLIPCSITDYGISYLQIVGFNKDIKQDGTYAKATVNTYHALSSTYRMNPARDDYTEGTGGIGGWNYSKMKKNLNNTFYESIPSYVKERIVQVLKTQTAFDTQGSSFNQTSLEKIFLPSMEELTTGGLYSDLYYDNTSRIIKSKFNDTEIARSVWLRDAMSINNFRCINSDGSFSNNPSSRTLYRIAFFCLD